ncbi:uncharacterized protein KGF55_003330 [Candida pseudojiufengensis]|uniref:uncharacterized protein n=1 Tax=Candida pseudojiufengensis TaxID=497109 RepID=UPI002224840A|nr:uncharacterized protein KGF55_003330 [Candida pseudojiufengensis]KAI5962254.1 hypothetical protein KGF55_003330 [Candida pseudojiufengensis]
MAPPVPVYTSDEIKLQYEEQLHNPQKYQCHLKSITQHECTFKPSTYKSSPEIICLPFKRIFQRCLVPTTQIVNGKKQRIERWQNIEITDEHGNRDLMDPESKYYKHVKEFLSAEKEFRELTETEYSEST